MNKERILLLADHLEKPETAEHFDMALFVYLNRPENPDLSLHTPLSTVAHHCGTTMCIAGHAALLFAPETGGYGVDGSLGEDLLGLNAEQCDSLFYKYTIETPDDVRDITNKDAARVLRHLAATGEVDWSICEYGEESNDAD